MAHCNFQLRGVESEEDELFIKQISKKLNIPLHIKKCPVKEGQNTQLAAREMRYEWFEQLKEKFYFDYIITAHHLNDAIETFFINLFRGTGLKGLSGIPQNETYLRPLLSIPRAQILEYARENNLSWREDSSNASLKYMRNKIRHKLIPAIKDIHPNFEESIKKTISHLQETNEIVKEWFENNKKNLIKKEQENEFLLLDEWEKIKNKNAFLYYWLKDFGFSDWESIYKLPYTQSGKIIENSGFKLVKHNNKLLLALKKKQKEQDYYIFSNLPSQIEKPVSLSLKVMNKKDISLSEILSANNKTVYIDLDKIQFPVIIRKKQDGDFFYPLGMKGKKKISDFYKDEKISLIEKEKNWLFCDTHNIIWVMSKRLDNRYKINEKTEHILKIEML